MKRNRTIKTACGLLIFTGVMMGSMYLLLWMRVPDIHIGFFTGAYAVAVAVGLAYYYESGK